MKNKIWTKINIKNKILNYGKSKRDIHLYIICINMYTLRTKYFPCYIHMRLMCFVALNRLTSWLRKHNNNITNKNRRNKNNYKMHAKDLKICFEVWHEAYSSSKHPLKRPNNCLFTHTPSYYICMYVSTHKWINV